MNSDHKPMKTRNCETCGTYPNCKGCVDESKYTEGYQSKSGVILWGAITWVIAVAIAIWASIKYL